MASKRLCARKHRFSRFQRMQIGSGGIIWTVWLVILFVPHMILGQQAASRPAMNQSFGASSSAPEEYELRLNGIEPTPENCLHLLKEGLPATVDPQKLPDTPPEKTQLAVDAMAILAKSRYRASAETLLSIARQDFPKGVQFLLNFDLAATAPENRELFRARASEILQYNAINALGLLGETRALPIARSVYEHEGRIAPKIQYALTLASLGDASGMDVLIQVISQQNRRESVAAAKAFALITGLDFGYTDQTPIKKRKDIARKYQEWWRTNKATFQPDPKAVLARRLAPEKKIDFQPRTTRDLVKLSSMYFDMENKPRVIEARERLAASGAMINGDLEKLMFDEMEDLNIRLEAMNWYYEINRGRAKEVFKRLRRDANPEIADKASVLLQKIANPETGELMIPNAR
ncbi:MAG: hypothetical protein ACPL7D_11910 [Candidatus Sumerlaeaceae bacterium]